MNTLSVWRNSIGYDDIFDRLVGYRNDNAFPPYNVEMVADNQYLISLAVAGYSKEEIDIEDQYDQGKRKLVIQGHKEEPSNKNFLYKGIASRSFRREFYLKETVIIKDANFENGILSIGFEVVIPEAMKPKVIQIK